MQVIYTKQSENITTFSSYPKFKVFESPLHTQHVTGNEQYKKLLELTMSDSKVFSKFSHACTNNYPALDTLFLMHSFKILIRLHHKGKSTTAFKGTVSIGAWFDQTWGKEMLSCTNIIFDPQSIYKSITCVYPMPSTGNLITKLGLFVQEDAPSKVCRCLGQPFQKLTETVNTYKKIQKWQTSTEILPTHSEHHKNIHTK